MNARMQPSPLEVRGSAVQPLGMSSAHFLRDYWQKQPLLIHGAFAGFNNPVAPDDLAGLACEELALSRIVLHEPKRDTWALRTGPFAESDFASLPTTHWTLLVQDVDKWDSDVAALLAHFSFLPSWRVDDVMVSYAEDGGSVGAHVDQYDVFLLQGLGRRRWQISADASAPLAFRDDSELKLLRSFTPTHEWILEPGDMLYLPPGVPHHGVALGACMTYSVGMRAPAQAELLVDFAEMMAERIPETARLSDADLAPASGDGEIDDAAITRVMRAMPWLAFAAPESKRSSASNRSSDGDGPDSCAASGPVARAMLRHWFGRFITRYRNAQAVAAPPQALSDAAFARAFVRAAQVQRNPWSRVAWLRDGGTALLFVAGEQHACSLDLARLICTRATFVLADVPAAPSDRAVLRTLIDTGHLAIMRATRASRST